MSEPTHHDRESVRQEAGTLLATSSLAGSRRVPVEEMSQVGEARRAATALAGRLGFTEERAGRLALMVTEAAANVARHATGGGELILRAVSGDVPGVEVLALDRGGGMADLERCLTDGFSTAGTPGTGLGSLRRNCDLFDLYSAPGRGTILCCRVLVRDGGENLPSWLDLGAVCLPRPGEEVSGDAWAVVADAERARVLVSDGLGHGPLAAEASQEAVAAFHAHPRWEPERILHELHRKLAATRGAAIAAVEIDRRLGVVRHAGMGNVSTLLVRGGERRHLVSHHGTVGHGVSRIRQLEEPWGADDLLILHTDGVTARWSLERYPGIAGRHPALIAAALYRDFRRGRDDATVVVLRRGRRP